MTIQEAIKSGKPIKRIKWEDDDWIKPISTRERVRETDKYLLWEDILATDWETKDDLP